MKKFIQFANMRRAQTLLDRRRIYVSFSFFFSNRNRIGRVEELPLIFHSALSESKSLSSLRLLTHLANSSSFASSSVSDPRGLPFGVEPLLLKVTLLLDSLSALLNFETVP